MIIYVYIAQNPKETDMQGFTDDIKIISSFKKMTKPYGKIESRATHGFIFRVKGSVEYFFNQKSVIVKEGEFVFLPQGSSYEYVSDKDPSNTYTSINFQGSVLETSIRKYDSKTFYGSDYICKSFTENWNFGTTADKYKCLSVIYDLMSHIYSNERMKDTERMKCDLIDPATEYLKSHLYDSNLKVEKLHRICGISDTYFRRIFTSVFHMTPQNYILTKRMAYAKSIIENGDYDTIKEVAEAVGYTDPLYFSKAFKKLYGVSPSNVNKDLSD